MVYMYTVYSDLMAISTPADYQRAMTTQKPRDAIIRRAMVAANIPDFPLPLEQAVTVNPFFKEKTYRNNMLNIMLIHKNGNNDIKYVIISNGTEQEFATRQEALNHMTNSTNVNRHYELASYKIDP